MNYYWGVKIFPTLQRQVKISLKKQLPVSSSSQYYLTTNIYKALLWPSSFSLYITDSRHTWLTASPEKWRKWRKVTASRWPSYVLLQTVIILLVSAGSKPGPTWQRGKTGEDDEPRGSPRDRHQRPDQTGAEWSSALSLMTWRHTGHFVSLAVSLWPQLKDSFCEWPPFLAITTHWKAKRSLTLRCVVMA